MGRCGRDFITQCPSKMLDRRIIFFSASERGGLVLSRDFEEVFEVALRALEVISSLFEMAIHRI